MSAMRRALALGALLAAACATEREPPRAAATAGGEELCTASVPEAVVRDVLGRVLRDTGGRPGCPTRHLLGDRMRVQADGRVDRVFRSLCGLQTAVIACTEGDALPAISFPPLERGACAWIDVPYDLVPAIDEPVTTDATPP